MSRFIQYTVCYRINTESNQRQRCLGNGTGSIMTSQLALTKKNRGVSGYDDSVISEPFARIATYNDEVQQFRKGKLKGRRRCCRRVFFLARVIMTSYIFAAIRAILKIQKLTSIFLFSTSIVLYSLFGHYADTGQICHSSG